MKKIKLFITRFTLLFRKKCYVVGDSIHGLIAYDESDYENVIESLNYVKPIEICRFTNWNKALDYVKTHVDEYSNVFYEDCFYEDY